MLLAKTLSFYKRKDVQEDMLEHAKNKEIAVKFDKGFGKRPEVLNYPNDILEFARQRAVSFHCSEELWKDPLNLTTDLPKAKLDELRIGWDLILDIDCKIFEYSKIGAYYTIKALMHHNIKNISCKFSGNKGFHIGVPWEAFPKTINNQPTKELFPEAPRKIAEYIKFLIKDLTAQAILKLEKNDFEKIAKRTDTELKDIAYTEQDASGASIKKLDAEKFLVIDTVFIASRHMYRMPYSFHEKSGLISIPIKTDEILRFQKKQAVPETIKIRKTCGFLDREQAIEGEATKLLVQAFDFMTESKKEDEPDKAASKGFDWLADRAVPETFFPPCIRNILAGTRDGRKRSIFILINFLKCMNWPIEKIEEFLYTWNKEKNPEKLREVYLKGQLRYQTHHAGQKKAPPPNCDNAAYYKDFGVCTPDSLCAKIKNPVQYVKRRLFYNKSFWKKTKKKTTSSKKTNPAHLKEQKPKK